MVKDPEVIAEMERVGLDLEPLPGEALRAAIAKTLATPDDVKVRARAVFGR